MRYNILSQVDALYRSEEGTEGERISALRSLEQLLKGRYRRADSARAYAKSSQVYSPRHSAMQAARPPSQADQPAFAGYAAEPPAPGYAAEVDAPLHPMPSPVQRSNVRQLVAFHQLQQNKQRVADAADLEVIRVRQWLHRQQCSLTPDGSIIWHKSIKKVVYDRDLAAQKLTKVNFVGGRLFLQDGQLLDTGRMVTMHSGPGFAIYVMSEEGNWHVSSHEVGHRHHSSLLAGANVSGAGELKAVEGRIVELSNKSGHYAPNAFQLLQALHSLERNKVPLDFRVTEKHRNGASKHRSVHDFMMANGFDNSTVESKHILLKYGKYLTADFLQKRSLMWIASTTGELIGGVYNTRVSPPQRLSCDAFSRLMTAEGLLS